MADELGMPGDTKPTIIVCPWCRQVHSVIAQYACYACNEYHECGPEPDGVPREQPCPTGTDHMMTAVHMYCDFCGYNGPVPPPDLDVPKPPIG